MLAARRPPVKDEVIDEVVARTVAAVASIRARGGEVVLLRPPSSGALRPQEQRRIARARGWDRLVAATGVAAVHFEDDPISRELVTAEMSHLTRECATVYTDDFVRAIAKLTPRLTVLPNAPPALTAADCPKPPIPP